MIEPTREQHTARRALEEALKQANKAGLWVSAMNEDTDEDTVLKGVPRWAEDEDDNIGMVVTTRTPEEGNEPRFGVWWVFPQPEERR